jgi:hypothetical protein
LLADGVQNLFEHTTRISQHVVVPKAQYQVSARCEVGSPPGVVSLALGMLPAIEFNDQVSRLTTEVDDVVADWGLPPEFQSI